MIQNVLVNAGESMMEAMHRAGIRLNAPCGGNHSCGKCRVKILNGAAGQITPEEERLLPAGDLADGWRLACAVYGPGEWTVETPEQDAGARVMTEGAEDGVPVDPMSRVCCISAEPPSLSDQRADAERIAPDGIFSMEALKKLPAVMRAGKTVYLAVFEEAGSREITDCAGKKMDNLGIAVDVGTTTMAAYLIDLETGVQLACASEMNPQRSFGGDVISRVDYAGANADGLNRLQSLVAQTIAQMGMRMLKESGKKADDVRHVVCVGNTIMMHLLAGLETMHIAKAPFTPVYAKGWSVRANELNIALSNAHVTLGPCVAGYVGADTVAAALACDMDQSDDVQLLIDIGTNGEIALGNRDGLICCSAAAGPAFEGAHIRCGSGAQNGAVDHVKIADGKVETSVLGGGEPKSICGSGLVDAIAQMLLAGVMDETGRIDEDFAPDEYQDYIFEFEGNPAFSLDGKNEKGVFVCQQDLREVQLAKAAIAAGVQVLMNEAGIEFDQVKKLCLAGGFGNYIDRDSAVTIGLLPAEMNGRIEPVGNAAGTGARQMLKNRTWSVRADQLREKMKYIELSARADFQSLFVEKMMFGDEEY